MNFEAEIVYIIQVPCVANAVTTEVKFTLVDFTQSPDVVHLQHSNQ